MSSKPLKPGDIVRSSLFPEPVQVLVVTSLGQSVKLIGKGLDSGKVYEPVLDAGTLACPAHIVGGFLGVRWRPMK